MSAATVSRWYRRSVLGYHDADRRRKPRSLTRLEVGVTFGRTGSNQNVHLNTNFDASGRGQRDGFGACRRLRRALCGSGRAGRRNNVRRLYASSTYTNEKGQLVLNFHIPTPGDDTFLQFKPDNSHTFYGGVGIPLVGRNVIPNIDEAAINLYMGYRHMTGDIPGSSNETGGGGTVVPLGGSFSQNGMVFGGGAEFPHQRVRLSGDLRCRRRCRKARRRLVQHQFHAELQLQRGGAGPHRNHGLSAVACRPSVPAYSVHRRSTELVGAPDVQRTAPTYGTALTGQSAR